MIKSTAAKKTTTHANRGGRPKKSVVTTAKTRYESCAKLYGFLPPDCESAALIGCPVTTIKSIRESMEIGWEFKAGNIGVGWVVAPRPEPEPEPPSLMERIMGVLGKLPKEDLQALGELLEERVA